MAEQWQIVFSISLLLVPAVKGQLDNFDKPSANISSLWVNNDANLSNSEHSSTGEIWRSILWNTGVACGFYKKASFSGYLFAVFKVSISSYDIEPISPVWAANTNTLVGENATLELTRQGNLVLRDANKTEIWSTGTIGRGVVSMQMFKTGNLVLRDGHQNVWESFSSPTDNLVPGRYLTDTPVPELSSTVTLAPDVSSLTDDNVPYVTVPPHVSSPTDGLAPPLASITPDVSSLRKNAWLLLLVLLVVLLLLVVVVVFLGAAASCILKLPFWVYKRLQQRRERRRRKEELELDAILGLPRRYSYQELQQATGNFSRRLGQGGFGTVFLAELPNNEKVAVKRLENASQGHKDFRTEVSIIGRVRHMNLVQLKGFCAENEYRMLVYELVVNGSLDKWLFPQRDVESNDRFLNWGARLNIALGVARGLAYLHEECIEKIFHLDVKPQNILLDADMNAKVCDFGLSRLVKQNETSVFTTMRGTPGYMAPEWLQSSITEKVDVYSYGVLLLELLSGKRCLDVNRLEDGSSRFHFPSWTRQKIAQGGSLNDVVDEKLGPELDSKLDQMAKVLDLALFCTEEESANRPSMGRVVQVLEEMVLVGEAHSPTESAVHLESDDELFAR